MMCMYEQPPDVPTKSRTNLLALVLLGVLLLSVLAAWQITRSMAGHKSRGEAIVQEIHKGLGLYWKGPSLKFYLIRTEDGKDVGWQYSLRNARKDGGFDGLDMTALNGQPWSWERYLLSQDARQGKYSAGQAARNSAVSIDMTIDTQIQLDGEGLRASQRDPRDRRMHPSRAQTPPNYLPEGTLSLAVQLVAKSKTSGFFQMILNDQPPEPGTGGMDKIHFFAARIEYKGQKSFGEGGTAVDASEVVVQIGGTSKELQQTYLVGPDGTILQLTMAIILNKSIVPLKSVPVSTPELLKYYPQALEDIRIIAGSSDMRLPAEPDAQATTEKATEEAEEL